MVTLDTGDRKHHQWIVLDTGGNGAIALGHETAQRYGLPGKLAKVASSRTRGTGKSVLAGDFVLLPAVSVGGFELRGVPAFVERPAAEHRMGDFVGTELLKRFHIYIDFVHDAVYLRPGPGFAMPFRRPGPSGVVAWAAAAGAVLLAALLVIRSRRARDA